MTFEPSDESSQRLCSAVPIVNDMIALEPDEQFSVTLATATPVGRFDNNETCITIIDDDGKYMHINYNIYQQDTVVSYNYHFLSQTVPEFNLPPLNIVVPEDTSEVEVCITLNGSLASNVAVTAETGSKSGASDQATGGVII